MTDNYYDSKEFRDILKSFEESERSGKSSFFDPDNLLDIVDYYCLYGKLARAKELIDRVLETFPDNDDALLMKARMLMIYEHKPDEAERVAKDITDKQDIDYKYLKAEIMLSRGQDSEAESLLQSVYDDDAEEQEQIAEEIAKIYIDYGCVDHAKAWLEKSGTEETDSRKELLARILMNEGETEKSQKILNELIDSDPYQSNYWNLLAKTQFMNDDIENAIISSEYSLAINPDDEEAVQSKANSLYQLGNYDEAIKLFRHFTTLRPDEDSGYMMLGMSMIAQGRLKEAAQQLKIAEKKISSDSLYKGEIYTELAVVLCKLGHYEEALEYIKRSEHAECDHTDMEILRGMVLMSKGEYEEGQQCYEKVLKSSGYSPKVYMKIGMALYESKLYVSAYLTTVSLIEIYGEEMPEVYAYHALFSLYAGHESEYLKYREIAFEKDPATAEALLGDITLDKQ
ncbi:MAG: tetratricopeptide repeat protein [Prevotella sp.]|uniref:tetratricopeptide repeat protein n=1 Tax=Prevotella sp. TaxID=59823 RepID=UPI002A2E061F|nr:tetratricopeptide repeat protein [Prevotella sp.]MDD7317573.1 tetratricopeptide repeat protein [Prevotellaceae bacterium]MDY4020580.1 tetratricopeptide repeat protein [Prevotella sp.]